MRLHRSQKHTRTGPHRCSPTPRACVPGEAQAHRLGAGRTVSFHRAAACPRPATTAACAKSPLLRPRRATAAIARLMAADQRAGGVGRGRKVAISCFQQASCSPPNQSVSHLCFGAADALRPVPAPTAETARPGGALYYCPRSRRPWFEARTHSRRQHGWQI